MSRRRFPIALALSAAAFAGLAASFYLGIVGEERFDPFVRLMMLSLPLPFAAGLFLILVALHNDDRFRAIVEERLAAAPRLGLEEAEGGLPAGLAAAAVFKRGSGRFTGRALRGTWKGGELFVIDHSYMGKTSEDDEASARRFALVFAFQVPPEAAGVMPPPSWKAEAADGWLVLTRVTRTEPLETALLATALAEARALALETLPS